ncbi:MAG: hypothetical protein NT062_12740 [Proteobacteria bacterium]|nr:hypothetical protein [Pseudomonadota bacterium]
MDFGNQIVQLCALGIEAESAAAFPEARVLFLKAWVTSTDDFEACIAAHYVARHQRTEVDTLRWHQLALARAEAATRHDDRALPFFALYHHNVGKAHEDVVDYVAARHHYTLASRYLPVVPQGPFRVRVEFQIKRGITRCDAFFSDLS